MIRTVAAALAVAGLAVAGCARTVNQGAVHGERVPGVANLWRSCYGPILVYTTRSADGGERLDRVRPGGCLWDAATQTWRVDSQPPPAPPRPQGSR